MRERPQPRDAQVSLQMQRMPRRDTGPEVALRRELHARGLRFRTQYRDIPGRPDIAFTRARLAVFVDGCFWHRCPQHSSLPKTNAAWWEAKLEGNVTRDRRQDQQLLDAGWTVIRVWEHEPVDVASDRIEAMWRALLGEPSRI
ncbi:very short patch repair endonuclease [Blastococcus sp. SYSU DS0533]